MTTRDAPVPAPPVTSIICYSPWFVPPDGTPPVPLVCHLYAVTGEYDVSRADVHGRVAIEVTPADDQLRADGRFAPLQEGDDPLEVESYRRAMFAATELLAVAHAQQGITATAREGQPHRFPMTTRFQAVMLEWMQRHTRPGIKYPIPVGPNAAGGYMAVHSAEEFAALFNALADAQRPLIDPAHAGGLVQTRRQIGAARTWADLDAVPLEPL